MTLPRCSTEATAALLSAWMLDIAWQGPLFARYCERFLLMAVLGNESHDERGPGRASRDVPILSLKAFENQYKTRRREGGKEEGREERDRGEITQRPEARSEGSGGNTALT